MRREARATSGRAASFPAAMTGISLQSADQLRPQVERILRGVMAQLRALVPDAELHHIGATALPGALTKGDVDVLLRVPAPRFSAAVAALRPYFAVKQPDNWTAGFASFGDDTGHELPLGVQVVAEESASDFLLFLRDYLSAHAEALAEYNRLKAAHAAEGPDAYWRAKDVFLSRILDQRNRSCTRDD